MCAIFLLMLHPAGIAAECGDSYFKGNWGGDATDGRAFAPQKALDLKGLLIDIKS